MNKQVKKAQSFTALLLALLLLASCSTTNNPNPDDTTQNADTTDTTDTTDTANNPDSTPEDSRIYPDLPEKKFDGAEYRISTFSLYDIQYEYSEGTTGVPLNDAIYNRNDKIAQQYDIDIVVDIYPYLPEEVSSQVHQGVLSDDQMIDLAMTNCNGAANLMNLDSIIPLDEVPYVDTTKPWWDQRSVEDLSIGGELYFALNSLNIMADNFTSVVFVNKDMLATYTLDNPYQLVDENKWTWDKMISMAKVASNDVDHDGAMTDKDTWGVLASYRMLGDAMANCGELIITKDADDYPVLALSTERSATVCEKLLNLLSDDKTVLPVDKYSSEYGDAWKDLMYPKFQSGNALFISRAYVQYVTYFRESNVTFGILPRPKFDSAQERYYTDVNYQWASTVSIPANVKDPEMAGIILEALAAESLYTVTPANYDVSIVNQQLRDVESERMLDIIYASRCFDYGQFFGFSGMNDKFMEMYKTGNYTFASDYAVDKNSSQSRIEDFINNFQSRES